MADGISLTASIISLAGLAYKSTTSLYRLLVDLRDAPKTLQFLNDDVHAVQCLLKSLQTVMEDSSDDSFSDGIATCLRESKPILTECSRACDELAEKIGTIMSNSDATRVSMRDRLKLQFEERSLVGFRCRIGNYKATINIAVSLASL